MSNLSSSEATQSRRKAIIIAGYYRSGTSALSGSLSNLGVSIPADAEGNEHNPKGFFESTKLIEFDTRVMNLLGAVWSDLCDLPKGWIGRADIQYQRSRLAEILSSIYGDQPLIAVKHPHICRLFPLYEQALGDLSYDVHVIHTHRSPYAIATSQIRKNNLSRSHALALWASYITTAEMYGRGHARAWVHYHDLLDNPDAAVRRALEVIGLGDLTCGQVSFVTKTLNRSSEAPQDGLFRPLHTLIQDVESAITLSNTDESVWDELRLRAKGLAEFVAEIGRTGNRAAPAVGGYSPTVFVPQKTGGLALGGTTHPLRPAERGDEAEANRVSKLLTSLDEQNSAPSVTVIVTAPEGTLRSNLDITLSSIRDGWHKPDLVLVCLANPSFQTNDIVAGGVEVAADNSAMTRRALGLAGAVSTDYVALIAAGDRLEPDAVARFTLAAVESGADLIYCDEIVNSQNGPWTRAKPRMNINRLMESCFVGDWVWYRRSALTKLGGFSTNYPGAEEQHLQVRLIASHGTSHHICEPLFVRGEDTTRDGYPLETSLENAEKGMNAAASEAGIPIEVKRSGLPGLFLPAAFNPSTRSPLVIGITCDDGNPGVVQTMVNRIMPAMGDDDILVFLRPQGPASPEIAAYLDKIVEDIVPNCPNIRVVKAGETLGGRLLALKSVSALAHIVLVNPVCVPATDDIVQRMGLAADAIPDCGVLAPKVFFRDREGAVYLRGPLLFGAASRVGDGSPADTPGPAGWLATTQPVDAVDGPIVLVGASVRIRGDAKSWVEVCADLRNPIEAFWAPYLQVEVADPRANTDDELIAARQVAYDGRNHHPAMTVSSSPLVLEGRSGLIKQAGRILITGGRLIDDGRILNAVRYGRTQGLTASFVNETALDVFSVARAMEQGRRWFRINPQYVIPRLGSEDLIGCETIVWSTLPDMSLRKVVLSAASTRVTSLGLATRLRGMGAKNVTTWLPKLTEAVWSSFTPKYALSKPVAVWLSQPGLDVPWIEQIIEATSDKVAWVVLGASDREFPGHVARNEAPVFEEGWARLFHEIGASILVRPTPDINWADDWPVLLGAAAGCRIIAGDESTLRESLPNVRRLPSGQPKRWIKAVLDCAEAGPDPVSRQDLFNHPDVWLRSSDADCLFGQTSLGPNREGALDAA